MQDRVLSQYRREFRYLTISSWNSEELRKLNLTSTVVPCGIDRSIYRVLLGEKRLPRVIMANARANPLKNFALTVEAWKGISEEERPEFWMYGVEPELARGLSPVKYFERPSDEEVNRLLNQASCFILTSRHEGFALTILEAMAAGCPVVCTDADGNRDFCVDGRNCLIVRQGDREGLRAAIQRLLGDTALQERLRQEGLKTAAAFDWNLQAEKLKDFFKGLG
jgi:glycosyltransferase involved in cell wall biosynthesis